VFTSSENADDGHINVRHVEPMMNTVDPILMFLDRCNTDVTSMLSGTAVKRRRILRRGLHIKVKLGILPNVRLGIRRV
jgi:hypothetical protein